MKIRLNGPVIDDSESWIYNMFGVDAIYPKKIHQQLEQAEKNSNEDVTVLVNSGGGSVFAASEIYTALKSYAGKVKTEIVGIAASAASVFPMAGHCSISPTAQIMIHNALMGNQGDYRSMDKASDILKNVNSSILNAYKAKTGKSEEEIIALMDEETWMTAEQALKHGFVDSIMFEEDVADLGIVASHESGALPQTVIKNMKKMLAEGKIKPFNETSKQPDDSSGALLQMIAAGGFTLEEVSKNIAYFGNQTQEKDVSTKEKGDDEVNLETIKNEHPELYKSIKDEGYAEGVKAENGRIQAIEDLSYPGIEELVNAAKFENGTTAPELAMQIVKAEKATGANFIANRNEDASNAGSVPAGKGSVTNEDENKTEKNISALAAAMGGKK